MELSPQPVPKYERSRHEQRWIMSCYPPPWLWHVDVLALRLVSTTFDDNFEDHHNERTTAAGTNRSSETTGARNVPTYFLPTGSPPHPQGSGPVGICRLRQRTRSWTPERSTARRDCHHKTLFMLFYPTDELVGFPV